MLQQNICGNAISHLGTGPDFGNGVLPSFLREAASARKRGANTALLLLRSAESSAGSDR